METWGWTGLLIVYLLLTLGLYRLAQRDVSRRRAAEPGDVAGPISATGAERFARVALVGLNAAANLLILTWLGLPGVNAALPAGVVLGAALPRVAGHPMYGHVLTWTAPLLPMTWPATGVGILALVLNWAGALVRPSSSPVRLGFDPGACTVIAYGGPLYLFRCGYNLGNIVFIHGHFVGEGGTCSPGLVAHETGHTLNVAAFGFLFHYIGAVHENWGPPAGGARHQAYAELWAESRSRSAGRPWVEGWAAAPDVAVRKM